MVTFKGNQACSNGCYLLSELRRRHRNFILNRFFLKTSFHSLLTFVYFCSLFDSLFFFLCLLPLIVSLDIDPVIFVLDLHMQYTVEWSLYVHILCGLFLCDSSSIGKKCCSCLCIHLQS